MKRISLLSLLTVCCAFTVLAQPIMKFETTEIDYGTIQKGADSLRVFKFTNTGDQPLRIFSANGSCGCTVPTFSSEPIQPGQSSEIEVRYDTQRTGYFEKTVTISNNEVGVKYRILTIKGTVLAPEGEAPLVVPGLDNTLPNGSPQPKGDPDTPEH